MPHKLAETIQKDIISAQKAGEKEKLDTLRLIFSEIKNKQIDSGKDLKDEEVIEILGKEVKKRKDSIKAFKDGGREELAKKEEAEIEIISAYLPEQMGEEEVRMAVKKILADNPDMDFGPLMGKAMGQLKGKADGGMVKQIVQEMQK